MNKSLKKQRGLTILELFITMGIVAIVSTLALSSISYLMDSSKAEDYTRELAKTVNFARVQAVSTGQTVTLCTLVDGACANDWTKDITIFIDSGNNRTLGTNTVLRIVEAIPSSDSLSYTGTAAGISFFPDGSIGDDDSGVFTYKINNTCDTKTRSVDINATGRARYIENVTCS